MHRLERPVSADLWFRARPRLAIAVAAALFAAVFLLRQAVRGPSEAVCLLYVLPIALIAFAFGRRAGTFAGAFGFALFAIWTLSAHVTFGAIGWLSRATPMLLLGVLVGSAADHQRRAAAAERELLVAQVRARQAGELNDSIIQRLAAAKWAAEAGKYDRSLDVLTETVESASAQVSELLEGRSIAPGEAVS